MLSLPWPGHGAKPAVEELPLRADPKPGKMGGVCQEKDPL